MYTGGGLAVRMVMLCCGEMADSDFQFLNGTHLQLITLGGHSGQIFCQTLAKSKSCIYRYIVLLKLGFITALPTTYYRFEAKPCNI